MLGKAIAAILALCIGVLLSAHQTEAATETLLQRGAYLVTATAACGRCHTQRDAEGKPVAGMELAGGLEFDDGTLGHIVVPNITPDRETGIGGWTEAQIVAALRRGIRPDGTIINAPMPFSAYRQLSDRDAAAIAAYLHRVKPIRHAVAKSRYTTPAPTASERDPVLDHVADPPQTDRVAYGGYLADPVTHCVGCHTPLRATGRQLDRKRAFAGGRELPQYGRPGAVTISSNITADAEDGLGKWSDEEIKRAITDGVRPDGRRLSRTMPFDWYKKMRQADLDALVAFLRTVKPVKNPE